MIYATKIKMKSGCASSQSLLEIDEIYLEGDGNSSYYKKDVVHDFVKSNSGAVKVNISPYPEVIPALSTNGEKYVRSSPNWSTSDNLLNLPRY